MKNILINGIAANSGGGKSILSNFLSILREKNSSYCFIILVPTISDYSIYSSRNIKIIEIPKVSGLLHLLIFYYSSINKIIVKYKIDLVFNLADVIIPNKEIKQLFLFDWPYAVYPNSIVWKKMDFKSFVLRRIKVFMFKKYSYYPKVIYCQTNSIRNRLGKYYSTQKLDIIPNAVAIDNMGGGEYKNFNFPENKKKFLCLSKYYSHKNLEIFLKVAEEIRKKKLPFLIILSLDKKECRAANSLLTKIKKQELEDVILNVGSVQMKNVPALYKQCDALLLPTLLESFSGTYVEAMYHKKPIFTSDMDFAKEVCGDAAFYFNPLDCNSVINSMLEINNLGKVSFAREKGTERLNNMLGWDKVTDKILLEFNKYI